MGSKQMRKVHQKCKEGIKFCDESGGGQEPEKEGASSGIISGFMAQIENLQKEMTSVKSAFIKSTNERIKHVEIIEAQGNFECNKSKSSMKQCDNLNIDTKVMKGKEEKTLGDTTTGKVVDRLMRENDILKDEIIKLRAFKGNQYVQHEHQHEQENDQC